MIRHVVMFKFYPSVSEKQKSEAISLLRNLKNIIPEIQEWSIGRQFREVEKSYDFVEVSSFKNAEALDTFRKHSEHLKVRDIFSKISDWIAVDYEEN